MEFVTTTSEAFEELTNSIKEINCKLEEKFKPQPLKENWLDSVELCELLKVSKRKLQDYRDTGKIPYSQIGAKIYYKSSDIDEYLESHYVVNSKKK